MNNANAVITSRHIVSLGVTFDQVTAKAEFETGSIELKAEHTVNLDGAHFDREDGAVGSGQIGEIQAASQKAVAGAIARLQAIVDSWFGPFGGRLPRRPKPGHRSS